MYATMTANIIPSKNSGFLHRVVYPIIFGWCFGVCIQFLIGAVMLTNQGVTVKRALFRASEITTRPYEALINGQHVDITLFVLPAFCAAVALFILFAINNDDF
jgi:hypothetical protein